MKKHSFELYSQAIKVKRKSYKNNVQLYIDDHRQTNQVQIFLIIQESNIRERFNLHISENDCSQS